MKRITLFLIAMVLMAGVSVKSQTTTSTSILNYTGLESKLKKSNEDIENVKKNTKAKTWTSRAQTLLEIYNVHNDILDRGMSIDQAKLFLKEPKEIQSSMEGNTPVQTYIYDRVNLKVVDNKVVSWEDKTNIATDPLGEAQKALDKAIELNTDGKADDDILKTAQILKSSYQEEAISQYEKGNYGESNRYFVQELNINKLPQMKNPIDTIIIYYAGRAAFEAKNYGEASRLFEEAASYNYKDPALYILRKQAFFAIGDTAKGVAAIQQGFEKYPEDQAIMIEMINYYLDSQQGEEALKLIEKAKAGDPTNVSYTFTEGTLFDKMGRLADAEKAYKECIAIKPDYYDAYYNLGVLYYNNAVKIYEEASKLSDNAAFEKKQAEGDEALKLAVEPMEKVAQMDAKDQAAYDTKRSALETLKTVYYRLKMEDKRQDVINRINAL